MQDVSQIGSGSISTFVTPRFSDHINCNGSLFMKLSEKSLGNSELNFDQEIAAKGNIPSYLRIQSDTNYPDFPSNAFTHCKEENSRSEETGTSHNRGRLEDSFLPCLVCNTSLGEKSKDLSPCSPSTRRRASLKISFKWGEGQDHPTRLSPRAIMQRPIAGFQVPCCRLEKKMSNSWSHIEPDTFKVRGRNYIRDKKKEHAPNSVAYYPFGVDVFLSPGKIDHIARFIELPAVDSSREFPPILVVNIQVPLYPAVIFQSEYEGDGMSIVLYFKLSERYSTELPVHFQESIRGENYFEIDLDMHRFSYIARKGFEAFQEKMKYCVLDFGLTIQGNKAEDLPEHMLCCIRLKEIDCTNYDRLGF